MRMSSKTIECGGQMKDRATPHAWRGATRHTAMRRSFSLLGFAQADSFHACHRTLACGAPRHHH
jgi:hypothetical protein